MEEVINILGSWNTWLPYANLAAILVLSWSIQKVVYRINQVNTRIDGVERGLDRVAGKLAGMAKRVYGKGKK